MSKRYKNGILSSSFKSTSTTETGWAGLFNGTSSYVYYPASNLAFQFGTGDFTIECWFYWNGTAPSDTNQYTLFSNIVSTDNATWDLQYYSGNWRFVGWAANFVQGSGSSFIGSSWNHIAVTRSGTTGTIWLNGTNVGSNSAFSTNLGTITGTPKIGYNGYNNYWNGYISNLRVTKGLAVYTGNFTIPKTHLYATQTASTNIATITNQTILLTLQDSSIKDNSPNNFTATNIGSVSMSAVPALDVVTNPFGPGIWLPSTIAKYQYSATWPSIQTGVMAIDYLVVAGGGGGTGESSGNAVPGGGGGAGGVVAQTGYTVTRNVTYTITIGSGGAKVAVGAAATAVGNTGIDSSLGSIAIAKGGGGSGYYTTGGSGGSGGGGGYNTSAGGTSNQASLGTKPASATAYGNAGATGPGLGGGGGGGGGAGAAGAVTVAPAGGAGGIGISSSITGTPIYYGGGGSGGGAYSVTSTVTPGGSGGGGSGGNTSTNATSGTVNTGGGGGSAPNTLVGGAGGSGVVIIRYADTYPSATVTGSPALVVSGGYRTYTFTGSGSIKF